MPSAFSSRSLNKLKTLHVKLNTQTAVQLKHYAHKRFTVVAQSNISRRELAACLSLGALVSLSGPTPAAFANDELPRDYEKTARALLEALRDSIDADLSGASEQEVRRKADPAKDLVRQFLTQWKDKDTVKDQVSHTELVAAIQELGAFYIANGQRSRMSDDVGNKILDHLAAAELALPPKPEKKSLLPF